MNNQPEWEKEYEKLMNDLPVNDYRAYHEDLISGEKRPNFRQEAIKSFISQTIESAVKEERERIKGILEGMRRADCNAKICEHWHGCDGDINATLSEALRKIDEI